MTPADRIIDYTARHFESGNTPDPYAVLTLDDAGAGISFGFIQFNQKMGGLPALFKEMNSHAPMLFTRTFGEYAPWMMQDKWVRDADLAHNPDFIARLRASGLVPEFQQAQRNIAKELYFDAVSATVRHCGLVSERAFAMAFDTAVQRGPGNANILMMKAAHDSNGRPTVPLTPGAPLATAATPEEKRVLGRFAVYADTTTRIGRVDRRSKMLADPGLADTAFDPKGA